MIVIKIVIWKENFSFTPKGAAGKKYPQKSSFSLRFASTFHFKIFLFRFGSNYLAATTAPTITFCCYNLILCTSCCYSTTSSSISDFATVQPHPLFQILLLYNLILYFLFLVINMFIRREI